MHLQNSIANSSFLLFPLNFWFMCKCRIPRVSSGPLITRNTRKIHRNRGPTLRLVIPLSFVKPRWKFPVERYRFIFYPSFSEKLFYTGCKREYKEERDRRESRIGGFRERRSRDVKVTSRNRKIDERNIVNDNDKSLPFLSD